MLLGILACMAATGASAQSIAEPPSAQEPVLRAGDMLRIVVWRQQELSGEFDVSADGTIAHPLYQAVEVGGVPLGTVESRLREFLLRYESNPQFVLTPLFRIAVGGEVRQPDLYTLPPEVTLAQAVATAGGATDRGRLDRVLLIRGGRTHDIDLTRPEAGAADIPVRSGDQIFVTRRVAIFRDYIAPIASVTGALAAIANIIIRTR